MKLPVVSPGQPCPTSAVTILGGTAPRVGTPVRFGFGVRPDGSPWPAGAYAFNKTVWELTEAPWDRNILLRGSRLDGQGKLYFGGTGTSDPGPSGITVTDAQGSDVAFHPLLRLPVDSNAAFYLYPTTKGCYAIQADSEGFSEVIVFKAS